MKSFIKETESLMIILRVTSSPGRIQIIGLRLESHDLTVDRGNRMKIVTCHQSKVPNPLLALKEKTMARVYKYAYINIVSACLHFLL